MDFYRIQSRLTKTGIEVYPDFKVIRSKDLMVRSKSFYAIWDDAVGLWSTDEYDVQRIIDHDLQKRADEIEASNGTPPSVRYLASFSTNSWKEFRSYVYNISDSARELDSQVTFSNTVVRKEDYVSRRLPYPLQEGDFSVWDEIISTLYDPDERAKIEWAIGAIMSGDAKTIQKFLVFYGAPGTGKSTIINIIEKLFEGYTAVFDAKALGSSSDAFSTEAFRSNPLVAIQHDGDLSKIEDNTKLNSIVAHEPMRINEKHKATYEAVINAFLIMGTNKPVKITDAKSGIIRRLIDVVPSGRKLSPRRYQTLMSQVYFQLGSIAWHCLETYRSMGRDYYSAYVPEEMMLQTDIFFNFIEEHYGLFKQQDGVSLTQAWALYQSFITESGIEYKLPKYKLREELRNYFADQVDRAMVDGNQVRNWYSGFLSSKFKAKEAEQPVFAMVLEETISLLDRELASYPAQYAGRNETPSKFWTKKERLMTNPKTGKQEIMVPPDELVVDTTLEDIDTTKIHYVQPPLNHIVIDFDLKDDRGEKSAQKNLEAASMWPPTYAEYSKGGGGIHLHYYYDGDTTLLAPVYSDGIEVKVFTGDSSLRRRLTKCNNIPIATINTALPLKEKKPMLSGDVIKSEKGLRSMIERNLRKEFHGGTKPSVDFIHHILEEAHAADFVYDVTDMRGKILSFAAGSTNQSLASIKLVQSMKFKSKDTESDLENVDAKVAADPFHRPIAFYDVEVYPNLFVICWKTQQGEVVKMINPTPQETEDFIQKLRLVGFNCRRYDNHIVYARMMGYTNEQLYQLSKKIISGDRHCFFAAAYGLSYTDIYDFSSKKQSLKKFEIELGIHHMESEIPWDEPVKEEDIPKVVEYCANDVMATQATFEARHADFTAREILADIAGLTVNDTTQKLTARIVFGTDKNAQSKFEYTDLSEMFPGYKFERGKSTYRGELVGEGGLVRAIPGMYRNVALLDVASMHPTSIGNLNAFGPYTKSYISLLNARVAIKRGEFDEAKQMFDGKLAKYLEDEKQAEDLSYALKIALNIVYGLTSASFDNPFRDKRNKDNIVAKRGALFMLDLKNFIEEQGFTPIHIKTDSVKIPDATPEIIDAIMEFGKNYGYEFEHEATYEKLCLVNDAVYIAKTMPGRKPAHWTATGAQFKHPFVFKTLFSGEDVVFEDYGETKQVTKGAIYMAMDKPMASGEEQLRFIGRIGRFVPVLPNTGGGELITLRQVEDEEGNLVDKEYAVSGTKGYFWKEAEVVKTLGLESEIDISYHKQLAQDAWDAIAKFGDVESFVDFISGDFNTVEEPVSEESQAA